MQYQLVDFNTNFMTDKLTSEAKQSRRSRSFYPKRKKKKKTKMIKIKIHLKMKFFFKCQSKSFPKT